MKYFRSTMKRAPSIVKGFSLIEMMVVIAIISIISSVVIVDRRGFNESIQLTSLAYDVALTIREAQVSGIAVKGYEESGILSFDRGFGVNFQEPSIGGRIGSYVSYVDGSNGNYQVINGQIVTDLRYNHAGATAPPNEAIQKQFTLRQGYSFSFCGHSRTNTDPNDYDYCSNSPTTGAEELNITFKRPEPDARIVILSTGGVFSSEMNNISGSQNNVLDKVRIRITSPTSANRDVIVYGNGQISVCRQESC